VIYGYARKSAEDQNLGIQIEELKNYGVDELLKESITGVSKNKELYNYIRQMQKDDTLVVTRMDRLGRNTRQLLETLDEIELQGVHLVIMDMHVDTRTPMGKFFLTVMSAVAELDRDRLKEKQMKGIALAKKEGRHLGRPRGWNQTGMDEAVDMYLNDYPLDKIQDITNIGRTTLYRELRKRGIPNRSR
jgi:DNA invertase Pin-like site-specific DNA recombinase